MSQGMESAQESSMFHVDGSSKIPSEHENEISIEIVDEGDDNPFEKKKRKKNFKVWSEFKEVTYLDGSKKVERIHCKNQLGIVKSGVTTHLLRHLKVCI